MLRVMIVDGSALFREGLRHLLQVSVQVVADVKDAKEACARMAQGVDPDIILFDCPADKVADYARAWRLASERSRLVHLTTGIDMGRFRAAIEAGIEGYVTKDKPVDTLLQMLQLVELGQKVYPACALSDLADLEPQPAANSGSRISERDKQILGRLLRGDTNKVIAIDLGVTEATVKVNLKSLLRKLNCANRTQAAIWAMNNGIPNPAHQREAA